MTPDSHPDACSSADENARQRCMMYVLGELSPQHTQEFERELAQSEKLQAELLVQSKIICGIATATPTPSIAASTHTLWRSVAIAALAACLMVAFVNWPAKNDGDATTANSTQPEGLLIAQAWADVSVGSSAPLTSMIEPDDFLEDEPETGDDSSLSWMVAAMESGAAVDG